MQHYEEMQMINSGKDNLNLPGSRTGAECESELKVNDGIVDSGGMSPPVVLASDVAYAMPLATTLRSIAEANPKWWPLDLHVLSDGFSKDMERKVLESLPKGSATIRWIPVDVGLFQGFGMLPHTSKLTYARLLVSHVLPNAISRALYLDTDLLVLDDLTPVWKTNLEGFVVGAVLDRWDLRIKRSDPGLEDVPRVRDYFNAGVLLLDLKRWREERISEKAFEYLVQHPQTPFADQDALNVACDGRWIKLNPRWNFHDHRGKRILDMGPEERPGVVHFVGSAKPWNTSIPNVNASLYDAVRDRTCFASTSGQKVWYMVQDGWFCLKAVLRRYAVVRQVWKLIRRPMT